MRRRGDGWRSLRSRQTQLFVVRNNPANCATGTVTSTLRWRIGTGANRVPVLPHNLTTSQPHNLRRFECWSEQRKTEPILLGYIETENAALPDGYHSPITLPSARRAVSRRMTRPVFSLTNRTAPSHSRNEHHRHGWKNILLEYVRERRLLYQR